MPPLSADTMPPAHAPDPHFVTLGGTLRDRFPADLLPAWLSEDDLDVYADAIQAYLHALPNLHWFAAMPG